MSVTVRGYKRGGLEVDVIVHMPDGTRRRERKKFSLTSRTAAQRWGEDRERHLLRFGVPVPKKEVPTLTEFAPRFQEDAVANRQKPSGVAAKETIIRVHLVPLLGTLKLDAITNERVQWLKSQLSERAPKTVNKVLTVLSTLLKRAVEWDLIDRMAGSDPVTEGPQADAEVPRLRRV